MVYSTDTRARPIPTPDYDVFIEGELVTLVSGGPLLTVVDYCDDCDTVEVVWFDGGSLEEAILPSAALVHSE